MLDERARDLLLFRLKINYSIWFSGVVCCLLYFLCDGELERLIVLIFALIFLEVAGPVAYRKVLAGGEAYHMLLKQSMNRSSSYGLFFACMVFDAFVFLIVIVYFIRGLGGCLLI